MHRIPQIDVIASVPDGAAFEFPEAGPEPEAGNGGFNKDGIDELMLVLDASRRVHTRHHFFSWTQGLLQNLLRHKMLICVLPEGKPNVLHIDIFSMAMPEATAFCATCVANGFGEQLIKAWERRRFRPLVWDTPEGGSAAASACFREMERMGSTHLLAHGMHDARGGMASFFIFCGDAQTTGPSQVELAELVVPFLHSAWMRAKLNSGREADKEQAGKPPGETLTVREQEILSWIYLGKSNYEIGTILSISPLTVKNHVQKILRKLNVVNRAQAVGKALDRRIISP